MKAIFCSIRGCLLCFIKHFNYIHFDCRQAIFYIRANIYQAMQKEKEEEKKLSGRIKTGEHWTNQTINDGNAVVFRLSWYSGQKPFIVNYSSVFAVFFRSLFFILVFWPFSTVQQSFLVATTAYSLHSLSVQMAQ